MKFWTRRPPCCSFRASYKNKYWYYNTKKKQPVWNYSAGNWYKSSIPLKKLQFWK